jgi:YD repeat-containing protein
MNIFNEPKLHDFSKDYPNLHWRKVYKDKYAGNILREEDSDGNWHEYTYDNENNKTSYINNKGMWYKIEYVKGFRSSYRNNNGFVQEFTYHSNGQRASVKQSENHGIDYVLCKYDLHGDIISETYSDGISFNFTYVDGKRIKTDSNGKIVETINPERITDEYFYF